MFVCSVLLFMHTCIIHVESTVKKSLTLDAEEPGAEYQQDQQEQHSEPEQYEGAEQDQAYDYVDYSNFSDLQGKHQSILTQSLLSVKSLLIYLCIKLIGIDLIPSCMR